MRRRKDGAATRPAQRFAVAFATAAAAAVLGCGDPTSPTPDPAEPDPVGVDGGSATADNGAASLAIPANALAQPTVITITPTTVASLGAHVPPSEFDASAGTVYGVAPIEGTIWDLQPDGLAFQTPATITLHYQESALPEGTSEEDLGIFVINGIFEELVSTVNPVTNTITAQIDHFSFAFTGPIPPPRFDLELTNLSPSANARVGEPLVVTAEVTNHGPGIAEAPTVLYQAEGNVELGKVDDTCDVVTAPAPGALAISCSVSRLEPDGSAFAAALEVVPQQAGETITIRATTVPASAATELDPDNDTQELSVDVAGEGALVDLKAGQPGLSPESDPRVGGIVGFVGRVDNLGSGTSSGATLLMEAYGDVELGDVPSMCTVVPPAAPAAAAIQCPVDPLAQHDFDLQGPLWLTIPSAGEIRVVATVTPASVDTDIDLENNVATRHIQVASTYLVDLEPVATPQITGTRAPGEPLTFAVRVGNYLPPSNGGEVIYEAHGDVTLGGVADGCSPVPAASVVSVACAFDPFVTYVNDTRGSQGELIPGWVGPFEVIPQSDDLIVFSATTVPADGDTDTNPDNDRLETALVIGQRTVDLRVVGVSTPASPISGQLLNAVATLRNEGPDDSRSMYVDLTAYGDVLLGSFDASCVEVPVDGPFPAVQLRCDLEPLQAQTESTASFPIIPQAAGLVTINVRVGSYVNEDRDVDGTNNSLSVNVDVGPGG